MGFRFFPLEVDGVFHIIPDRFEDKRGFFQEIYRESVFKEHGIDCHFVQINTSYSKKGVIRGLHYQLPPHPQAKLVRCIYGEVFDVALDVRASSPSFGRWAGETLSMERGNMLFIPVGFAHGFEVLSDFAIIEYLVSDEYCPECEAGVNYKDEDVKIKWQTRTPILSEKDLGLPYLKRAMVFR